ncbi:MAG: hypothetical protein J5I65_04310 [Aridibacter famidurans]|nr:hypothetical protein [Aridibacter famidurans]
MESSIRLGAPDAFISFRFLAEESSAGGYSEDFCFYFSVKVGPFSCVDLKIWIDRESLRSFLAQIEKNDVSAKARLELNAMSPEDFKLEVESSDSLGHYALDVSCGKWIYVGNFDHHCSTNVGLGLDQTDLARLATYFRRLSRKAEP